MLGLTVLTRAPGYSDSISSISPSILFFGSHSKVALTLVKCSLCLTVSWLIKFDYLSFNGDRHVTKDLRQNISQDRMTWLFLPGFLDHVTGFILAVQCIGYKKQKSFEHGGLSEMISPLNISA